MSDENKSASGLMTVQEVAEYLSLSTAAIYQRVSRDQIPYVKLGRAVRFRRSEIDAWVDEMDAQSKSKGAC